MNSLNSFLEPEDPLKEGQIRKEIIELNNGKKGFKKWEWIPSDDLAKNRGEWVQLGSPGDGSVYIPGIGSIFDLETSVNLHNKNNHPLNPPNNRINNKYSHKDLSYKNNSKLKEEQIRKEINESNEQIKVSKLINLEEWINKTENIFKKSFNENLNDNRISEYKVEAYASIKKENLITFENKIYVLNKNIKIDIFELYLPEFIYESLKRNNIHFVSDLVLYDREKLININNFSEDNWHIIIDSIVDFDKNFSIKRVQRLKKDDEENNIKPPEKSFPIKDLNLSLRVYNPLRRNGIEFVSDIFNFSEEEIK